MQCSELQLDLVGKNIWIERSLWEKGAGKIPKGISVFYLNKPSILSFGLPCRKLYSAFP